MTTFTHHDDNNNNDIDDEDDDNEEELQKQHDHHSETCTDIDNCVEGLLLTQPVVHEDLDASSSSFTVTVKTNDVNDDTDRIVTSRDIDQYNNIHDSRNIQQNHPVIASLNAYEDDDDDGNDKHDDISVAMSSSSSSSSISHDPNTTININNGNEMTLTERRAHNIERNHKILHRLGIIHNNGNNNLDAKQTLKRTSNSETNETIIPLNEDNEVGKRAMILPTCYAVKQQCRAQRNNVSPLSIQQQDQAEFLYCRYPHRSIQIRKLYSLLSVATSSQSSSRSTSISPPIIVTGPAGSGKTSIVSDVVQFIQNGQQQQEQEFNLLDTQSTITSSSVMGQQKQKQQLSVVLNAFIDCHTLDQFHIDVFLSNVYNQWRNQILSFSASANIKRRSNESKHQQQSMSLLPPSSSQIMNQNASADGREDEHILKRVARIRRVKTANANSRNNSKTFVNTMNANKDRPENYATHTQGTVLTTIWMFGRSIQRLMQRYKCHHNTSLILIIDHADSLLSASIGKTSSVSTTNSGTNDKINLLVQLMLLPNAMDGFNLTIIFISKNILLEHVALNNMSSHGTIHGHICPITINFPAYRGKALIQKILLQERMKSLIVGSALMTNSLFGNKVYVSFLETLIQALSDLTSNLNEYVRLGRGLWPIYIFPILSENIKNTFSSLQKSCSTKGVGNVAIIERDVLSYLDQRIFPHIRIVLEHGLGILSFDSSGMTNISTQKHIKHDDLPILVKYLLLAAYICHANRQDKDRQLFSIERNGRKRRKTKDADVEEETAFGTGPQQDQPKTIRPRTFPLERLYSLFVSIVSLNASTHSIHLSGDSNCNHQLLQSLGSIPILESVAYLRDIGVLHDYPKRSATDPIRFSQRYFWTSITREEAQSIAVSVNFPLDRYTI